MIKPFFPWQQPSTGAIFHGEATSRKNYDEVQKAPFGLSILREHDEKRSSHDEAALCVLAITTIYRMKRPAERFFPLFLCGAEFYDDCGARRQDDGRRERKLLLTCGWERNKNSLSEEETHKSFCLSFMEIEPRCFSPFSTFFGCREANWRHIYRCTRFTLRSLPTIVSGHLV